MEHRQFISIDGFLVDSIKPFLIIDSDAKISDSTKKKDDTNLTDFAKLLFEQNLEEIQQINEAMLRYGSVSSLRDQKNFSPPSACPTKQEDSHPELKKTIFMNQFIEFDFVDQQSKEQH